MKKTDKAETRRWDRQADRDMNKKWDRRRDGALGHVKATAVTAVLLAPVAKWSWGEAKQELHQKKDDDWLQQIDKTRKNKTEGTKEKPMEKVDCQPLHLIHCVTAALNKLHAWFWMCLPWRLVPPAFERDAPNKLNICQQNQEALTAVSRQKVAAVAHKHTARYCISRMCSVCTCVFMWHVTAALTSSWFGLLELLLGVLRAKSHPVLVLYVDH